MSREKIENNIWENNFDEVIAFIKEVTKSDFDFDSEPKWNWMRNPRCKYVQLRIDMRDGGFVILDRDNQRITFDELKYQYRREDE